MRGEEKPKPKLEEYIAFFQNSRRQGFTIYQLNQIIFMHGFIKLHRHPKMSIMEALNSLELMSPSRSTLGDPLAASSSSAVLSLEEVKQDIETLGWQECPIGSVKTLRTTAAGQVEEEIAPPISSSAAHLSRSKATNPGPQQKGRKGRRKRALFSSLTRTELE